MKYLKPILAIFAIIMSISIIGASIYALIFFRTQIKKDAELFQPTTIVSDQACEELPEGTKFDVFSVRMRSQNVEEAKKAVEELVVQYEGEISSSNISQVPEYFGTERIILRTANLSFSIPVEDSEEFRKDLSKLLPESLAFDYEYLNSQDAAKLQETCLSHVISLQKLQTREKLYLDQLQRGEGDTKEIFDNLAKITAEAGGWESSLRNLLNQQSNKLQVNLTIQEFPG